MPTINQSVKPKSEKKVKKPETFSKVTPAKQKEKAHQLLVKKRRAARLVPSTRRKPEKKKRMTSAEMPPKLGG